MTLLCECCLKCGQICCGCIPLRKAAFIAVLCFFIFSCIEVYGELTYVQPMLEEKEETDFEKAVFYAAKAIQIAVVFDELVLAYAIWKRYPKLVDYTSILFVVGKGLRLLISLVNAYVRKKGYGVIFCGVFSAVLFFVPIIWSYNKAVKKERQEALEAAENAENEEQQDNPTN